MIAYADLESPTLEQELEWIQPPIQHLVEQFGPEWLAWGSDWPLVLLETDYAGGLEAVRDAQTGLAAGGTPAFNRWKEDDPRCAT